MLSHALLLFIVTTTLCYADRDAVFPLRHLTNDAEHIQLLAYAGFPPRAINYALFFAVPASSQLTFSGGHAMDVDLPGQFAALQVHPLDELSKSYRSRWTATGTASVLQLPKMKLESLGDAFWFSVNMSSYTMDQPRHSHMSRGALYIGPGSSVYARWRFADVTRSRLTFSDHHTRRKNEYAMTCDYFDHLNRCVMHVPSKDVVQVLSNEHTKVPVKHTYIDITLDFSMPMGELPGYMYADLLATQTANTVIKTNIVALQWHGHLMASVNDVGSGSTGSTGSVTDDYGAPLATTPMFVVSEDNTIVLGRRALARLFRTWTYDSSTATFYMTFNDDLPEVVRIALSIMIGIQSFILVSYIVSPFNLSMRDLLTTTTSERPQKFEMSRTVVIIEGVGMTISLIQATLAYLYVGDGFGVDFDLSVSLQIFCIIALVIIVIQCVLWILFSILLWPKREVITRGHLVTSAFYHAIYASTAVLGITVAYLPAGVISMVPLIISTILCVSLSLTCLLYNVLMVGFFACYKFVREPSDYHFKWTIGGALIQFAIIGVLGFAWAYYMMIPVVNAWNVRFDRTETSESAYIFLGLVAVGVELLILGEARDHFARHVSRFETKNA